MQLTRLFIATVATVITGLGCAAQTNLITNGTFESWSGSVPTGWSTNTSANLYRNTGLGSGTSAVAQNKADLRQVIAAAPKDFSVSLNFAINQSDTNSFSQPLFVGLYQTSNPIDATKLWIHLRLSTFNASTQSYSLAVFDGSEWQTLTDPIFTPSVLNSGNATFSSVSQYQLKITYNDASNTYSISYGTAGGPVTTLSALSYFRNPTTHDGLKGLQFYSNDNGFALDNVTVKAVH